MCEKSHLGVFISKNINTNFYEGGDKQKLLGKTQLNALQLGPKSCTPLFEEAKHEMTAYIFTGISIITLSAVLHVCVVEQRDRWCNYGCTEVIE